LHYWVSIASIRADGTPDLHWPKFYVKSAQFKGYVSDGGQNPFPDPQPMQVLLLRVDDGTNQRFIRWLGIGASEGYPGLAVKREEIVAQVAIRFP
jgi:hypothetical protein